VCSAKATRQDFFVDEILPPIDTKLQQVEMSIKASLHGIADEVITGLVLAGFGTYTTAAGYKQNTIGYATDAFTGIALIAPMREDPTKVLIFHLYKAINDSGLEFGVTKTALGASEAMFKGYAITTRATSDQIGNYWWQI
jgi:hypothetical protein